MLNVAGADWLPRKNGKILAPRAVLMIVLGGLLVLSLSRPFMLMTDAIQHSDGVSWRLWGYAALLIMGLSAAWIDSPPARMAILPPLVLALVIWSAFSISWSATPAESVRRLALTVVTMWLTFVAVDRIGASRSFLVAQSVLLSFLIINYYAVIFFPAFAIDNYYVAWNHWWQGIMSHKNLAGMSSGLAVLFFLLHGKRHTRIPRYIITAFAALFVGLTQSRTSWIATSVGVALGFLTIILTNTELKSSLNVDRVKKYLLVLGLALTATMTFLVVNGTWLLKLTQNPDLFTGRAQIWQPMLSSLAEHPFSGVGYGAYWTGALNSSSGPLAGVTQAHNGYLDIVVQIGLPGLLLALAAFTGWPLWLITRIFRATGSEQTCALAVAVSAFFLISNIAETSLFDGDQIPQVFMTLTVAALAASLRRQKTAPVENGGPLGDITVKRRRRSTAKSENTVRRPRSETQLL